MFATPQLTTSASPLHAAIKLAINLRGYQVEVIESAISLFEQGIKGVMIVLPTGAGKTVCMGAIISRNTGPVCAIAHRQELVGQISMALARVGIVHQIIAPDTVVKAIIKKHIDKIGTNFVNPNASVAVAGVDSIKGRVSDHFKQQVTLVVIDEGHHLLRKNKWGKAVELFSNKDRKLLTVTATAERADGKGLGAVADGFIDEMVVGPDMRYLIDHGYLTDFNVAMPKSDIELTREMFTASGELNETGKKVVRESHIIGDTVKVYQELSPGKPCVAFCTEVSESIKLAAEFRKAGIPALHVDGNSSDAVRDDAISKLERGEILMLCNVGLFGEGFDLPAIFGVYDCAATESYSGFAQRFGRPLRLDISAELQRVWESLPVDLRLWHIAQSPKPKALYVDLVGNIIRHGGTPDTGRVFTLSRRERKGGAGVSTVKLCRNIDVNGTGLACGKNYKIFLSKCPYCGFIPPPPEDRSSPEKVEGDVYILDQETLDALRARRVDLTEPAPVSGVSMVANRSLFNKHHEKINAQKNLRDAIAWFLGERRAEGLQDDESVKAFYNLFRADIITVQSYGKMDADKISDAIDKILTPASLFGRIRPHGY